MKIIYRIRPPPWIKTHFYNNGGDKNDGGAKKKYFSRFIKKGSPFFRQIYTEYKQKSRS